MNEIKKGDIFTFLTIKKKLDKRTKNGGTIYLCQCKCGNLVEVSRSSLVSGNTKSCGCLQSIRAKEVGKQKRELNKYDLTGDYGIGYTSKGEEFYFDLEDYDLIKDYTWNLNDQGYVLTTANGKSIRFHRLVMNAPKELDVDHIHGKRYDNRKSELRLCSKSQNLMNTKTPKNNTSGRKGVYWDKNREKWMAVITANKKVINLGRYSTFDEAVKARQTAEAKYFGEFKNEDSDSKIYNKQETYENNNKEKEVIHTKYVKNTYSFSKELCYCKIESWNNKNTIFFTNESNYNLIKEYTWQVSNLGIIYTLDKNKHYIYLHTLLTTYDYIKFKDSNLNNYTLSNLQKVEFVTENNLGITYNKKRDRYAAYININKKRILLGSRYIRKEDAIIMRKMAEINLLNQYKKI